MGEFSKTQISVDVLEAPVVLLSSVRVETDVVFFPHICCKWINSFNYGVHLLSHSASFAASHFTGEKCDSFTCLANGQSCIKILKTKTFWTIYYYNLWTNLWRTELEVSSLGPWFPWNAIIIKAEPRCNNWEMFRKTTA